jgi:hypothetical protein
MMVMVGFGIFLPFERAAKGLNFVVLESSCLIKAGHEGGNSNQKERKSRKVKVRWKMPEAPDRGQPRILPAISLVLCRVGNHDNRNGDGRGV